MSVVREPEEKTLAQGVADYIKTHKRWNEMTRTEVAYEAVMVVLTDPGAARKAFDILSVHFVDDAPVAGVPTLDLLERAREYGQARADTVVPQVEVADIGGIEYRTVRLGRFCWLAAIVKDDTIWLADGRTRSGAWRRCLRLIKRTDEGAVRDSDG